VLDTATYLPTLAQFEGAIPWMYVDTTGNVTVGVGNLLSDVAAAQALSFVLQSDPTTAATPDQIASDFSALIGKPDGQPSGYYRGFTSVRLTNEAIQSLLSSRVTGFLKDLTAAFPDYDSYPAPACAAIFDMAFNLGLEGLTGKFPHFCAAVKAQDWTTAAAQCQRGGIGASRNNWTNAQFLQAAQPNQ